MKTRTLLGMTLTALLPAVALAAGMATVTNRQGETGHVYWQNGTIVLSRLGGNMPASVMLRDDEVYFIFPPDTEPRVVEMSGMVDMARAMASKARQPASGFLGRITSVAPTGKTVTIAGIEGRVYDVTVVSDGQSKTYRTVLTDNPAVVRLTELVVARAKSILGEQGDVVARYLSAFPDDYRGILKLGREFRFTSVTSEDPPDRRFELPAEPVPFAQAMIMKFAEQTLDRGKSRE